MADVFRRILYPAFVMVIVATVWTMGQAKAASDAAERNYWAPLHPSITGVDPIDVPVEVDARNAPSAASLNQVLLEDDEVIGVR